MSIGKNCIVISQIQADIPDNHLVIDHGALDLSLGPALLGPGYQTPYCLLFRPDQIMEAIQELSQFALDEKERTGQKPTCVADALGLKRLDELTETEP